MARRFLVPLMVLGLLALAPSSVLPALGGNNKVAAPFCDVSDETVVAGQTIMVTGDHWFPGKPVRAHFAQEGMQENIGRGKADDGGMISFEATIPGWASLGPANIVCKGKDEVGNTHGDRQEITVVPCLPSGPPMRGGC